MDIVLLNSCPESGDFNVEPGVKIATPLQTLAGCVGGKSTTPANSPKPVPHIVEFFSEVPCFAWFGWVGKPHNTEF